MWKVFAVVLVLAAGLVIGLYCSLIVASRADDEMEECFLKRQEKTEETKR